MQKAKTLYDLMREAENKEEDACYPEEWEDERQKSSKEKYFEYYRVKEEVWRENLPW